MSQEPKAKPKPNRWIVWIGIDREDAAVLRTGAALVLIALLIAVTLGLAWRVFHFAAGFGGW